MLRDSSPDCDIFRNNFFAVILRCELALSNKIADEQFNLGYYFYCSSVYDCILKSDKSSRRAVKKRTEI